MTPFGAARYGIGAVAVAVASGVGVWTFGAGRGGHALGWALAGWSAMALVGVAGGVWAARTHGRPGSGFLAAIAASMLGRLALAALGAWGAASRGGEAVGPFLVGLGAGFVPLQAFEVAWFVGKTRRG